jgi:GT2 family glycosyltransferase
MFVDSDVELAFGCISQLRSDIEKYGWAGIHARLLSDEDTSYWQRAEDTKYRRKYGRAGPTTYIDTIVALFRREDLLRHPIDPYFRESSEDVDLSHRLVSHDRKLGVSTAIAYHHHRREFSAFARQRFNYGLGTARLALKYRSIRILLGPVSTTFSETIRAIVNHQIGMIPYWLVGGTFKFLGVIVGVAKVSRSIETDQGYMSRGCDGRET